MVTSSIQGSGPCTRLHWTQGCGRVGTRVPRTYWAETVKYWFWESLPPSLAANYPKLADYDPDAAKLVEEVLGDATVPPYCKP